MKRQFILLAMILLALGTFPELLAQSSRKHTKPPTAEAKAGTTKAAENEADAPVKQDLKRLILKDGSYQPITKYQIIGDRVHYFSAERYQWEDIPTSLIDWEASKQYTAQAARPNTGAREVDEEAAREKAEQQAKTPEVSPGIRLPQSGVFLLDVYQGKAELNQLSQNGAEVNKNTAGNILRGIINPISSAKQSVELQGPHAQIQAHVGDPFIYVSVEPDDPEKPDAPPDMDKAKKTWRLVKLQDKKGNRIVGNVNIAIYGKVKEKAQFVDAKVTPVSGPWIEIVPAQPLQPGEYALIEMLPEGMNRFVWDFGVNPQAEPNPGAWKPVEKKVVTTDKQPELNERKP